MPDQQLTDLQRQAEVIRRGLGAAGVQVAAMGFSSRRYHQARFTLPSHDRPGEFFTFDMPCDEPFWSAFVTMAERALK